MIRTLAIAAALLGATAAQAVPQLGTVFVIAMENHNFTQPSSFTSLQQIQGNPAASYINSLITPGNSNAALVSYASSYTNVPPQAVGGAVHPSEPNYVWAEAGVAGPRNDSNPYPNNIVNSSNLSGVLQANGISWKSYQEDTDLVTTGGQLTSTVAAQSQWTVPLNSFSGTSASYTNAYNGSSQYDYASKHNPQLFFTDTNGGNDPTSANSEVGHYAPLQQLATDLTNNTVAKYNWITPDQFNDMHTTLTGGFTYNGVSYTGDAARIAQGDNFLSQVVPLITASTAFQNNGTIIIWNDETEGGDTAGFTSTEIVISKLAKGNAYNATINYTHSSDLKTMQEIFHVDPSTGQAWIGDAAAATDLSDLFQAGAVPQAVPEPATWAMMFAGFGLVGNALRRRTRTTVAA